METKFNFNSSVCTSIEQSERLLALGLKKETADCYYWQECDQYGDPNGRWHLDILNDDTREHFEYLLNHFGTCLHIEDSLLVPAWSLHRLILLLDAIASDWIFRNGDCYTNAINRIEWLIKEGYFNKEYLNGTSEN